MNEFIIFKNFLLSTKDSRETQVSLSSCSFSVKLEVWIEIHRSSNPKRKMSNLSLEFRRGNKNKTNRESTMHASFHTQKYTQLEVIIPQNLSNKEYEERMCFEIISDISQFN